MKGLIDTTLREGSQAVGVRFGNAEAIRIVDLLSGIGIEEIEIGVSSAKNTDLALLAGYCRRIRVRYALWCRCNDADIEYAANLRPDVLSLSIPVSDLHIRAKLGRDRTWVVKTMRRAINHARKLGIPSVSIGFEDVSRAEPGFLHAMLLEASSARVDRVRLADTVGIWTPNSVTTMIQDVRKVWAADLAVHCHNDFGMATANAVTALESGADWADVTVLGLGERAGAARLEEVAGFLALRSGKGNYDAGLLSKLCAIVAEEARVKVAASHPVVGSDIFRCESGLHLHGLQNDPATYEPYPPERVGGQRQLLYGSKIGRRAMAGLLAGAGLHFAAEKLDECVRRVADLAACKGRPLEARELLDQAVGLLG